MPTGRVVLGAACAGALCSCSFGYDLLLDAIGTGGASAGFAGAGGTSVGEAGAGSGGSAPSSGGVGNPGGAPTDGGAPGSGGTVATGGQLGLGGQDGDPPLDLPRIPLSAGATHTCALAADDHVYCWGDNTNEALGGFVGASSSTPVPVTGLGASGEFVALSVGSQNACGLTAAGDVYCWGDNTLGPLGQGDTTHRADPVLVPLPERAVQVDLGYDTACTIDELGALYCWGENAEGQAGQSDLVTAPVDASSPLEVPSVVAWQDVSTGNGHVCAIRVDGQLYCWGRNTDDQLGQDGPLQIRTPTRVGTDDDWAKLSVGQSQTCALKTNGTLYCWGDNSESQLGIEPPGTVSTPTQVGTESDWTAIALDVLHACGIRAPGTLHCWGRRQEGQLTLPYDPMPVVAPFQVGTDSDWTDVSVGRFHTCGLRNGALLCTGENTDGRLGDGTMARSYGFVSVLPF